MPTAPKEHRRKKIRWCASNAASSLLLIIAAPFSMILCAVHRRRQLRLASGPFPRKISHWMSHPNCKKGVAATIAATPFLHAVVNLAWERFVVPAAGCATRCTRRAPLGAASGGTRNQETMQRTAEEKQSGANDRPCGGCVHVGYVPTHSAVKQTKKQRLCPTHPCNGRGSRRPMPISAQ